MPDAKGCHWPGCQQWGELVAIVCPYHWEQLPRAVQLEQWAAYASGAEAVAQAREALKALLVGCPQEDVSCP